MATWYSTGTVSVTNGLTGVTGTGTAFDANARVGDAFIAPDGKLYEIVNIASSTVISIRPAYLGTTASGQNYSIAPIQGYVKASADALKAFTAQNIEGGLAITSGGTGATTASDARNNLGITSIISSITSGSTKAGDADKLDGFDSIYFAPASHNHDRAYLGIAAKAADSDKLDGMHAGKTSSNVPYIDSSGVLEMSSGTKIKKLTDTAGYVQLANETANPLAEFQRWSGGASDYYGAMIKLDSTGLKFLNALGTISGTQSFIERMKINPNGDMEIGADLVKIVNTASTYAPSFSNSILYLARANTTDRSINASGTINASGADYAEYMTKANNCGDIAKGDVCGVDIDGKLTDKFSEAIHFVVKSTDPCLIGGDTWGTEDIIGIEPVKPIRVEAVTEQRLVSEAQPRIVDTDGNLVSEAVDAIYETVIIKPAETDEEFAERMSAYEAELAVCSDKLEAERQKVDRIAFSGQVPINITEFNVGDYIVPVENENDSITGVAVSDDDITFAQYKRAVGRVIAREDDGRARIIVKVI